MEITAATTNTTAAVNDTARRGIAQDFDKFLFLLTQQLKNQDPLQPMETSEFTNQLVQFANVEQNIESNTKLQNILDLQERNGAVSAVGYIGKEVEVLGNKLPMVDGQAKFKYNLPEKADSIRVEIRDSKGVIIRELDNPGKEAGNHEMVWDGRDRFGAPVPEGAYTVNVRAVKLENGLPQTIEAAIGTLGRVTGLINLNGRTNILLGNAPYSINEIIRVREATAPITVTSNPDAPVAPTEPERNFFDALGFGNSNPQFTPYGDSNSAETLSSEVTDVVQSITADNPEDLLRDK